MTRTSKLNDLTTTSDDELLAQARDGDRRAYGELWRRHSGVGLAMARRFTATDQADDLVAEAFTRILSTMQRGGGPVSGFRPYLITTIRNVATRWAEKQSAISVDDFDQFEDPATLVDPAIAALDRTLTLTAFRSLPERWQTVLWYSEVEGMDPHEIAPFLGMTPNATAALSYRARAGLRTAWLQAHLNDDSSSPECRWTTARLSGYIADKLTERERLAVAHHLETCTKCTIVAGELDHIGARLAFVLIPLVAGAGVGASLIASSAHASAGTTAAAAAPAPAIHLASFTATAARATMPTGWIVAAALTVGVVAAGGTVIALSSSNHRPSTTASAPSHSPSPRASTQPTVAPTTSPSTTIAAPTPILAPPAASPPAVHTVSAPATPAQAPLSPSVVISSPANGLVTNVAAPVFSGTGAPGATVSLSTGGATRVTTIVNSSGHWSVAVPLADGQHSVAVSQVDGTDRPSAATTIEVTVDTVAPAAPVVLTAVDDAALAPFTLSGTGEPNATVSIFDDHSALIGTAVVSASGTWTSPTLSGLLPTVSSLSVTQKDAAGNVSPAATVGPFALVPTVTSPADGAQFASGVDVPISLQGWAGTSIQVSVDGAVLSVGGQATGTVGSDGALPLTVIGLPVGAHTLGFRYVSADGSSAGQAILHVTVNP